MANTYVNLNFNLTGADISFVTSTNQELPPLAPTDFEAEQSALDTISLTWVDNAADETGFEIDRKVDAGAYSLLTTVGTDVTSYDDDTVTIGSTYQYRIRAVNGAGASAYIEGSAIDMVYQYGYPLFGPSEANVAAQWAGGHGLGSATAGANLTDTVAALSATKVSTPTYDVAITGDFAGLTPGITTTATAFFSRNAAAALDPGTGSMTIELWLSTTEAAANMYLMSGYDGTNKGYEFLINPGTGKFVSYLEATDGSFGFFQNNLPTGWNDGNLHKWRLVINRTNDTFQVYMDGAGLGSNSIAGLAGKTVKWGDGYLLARNNGTTGWRGTCAEMRFSKNATNNSGGPNGG